MELYYRYEVKNIIGIKYGLQGLIAKYGHDVVELTPETVKDIHIEGGSILSSSRGKQNVGEMVNTLNTIFGADATAARRTTIPYSMKIIADERTNSILVRASEVDT